MAVPVFGDCFRSGWHHGIEVQRRIQEIDPLAGGAGGLRRQFLPVFTGAEIHPAGGGLRHLGRGGHHPDLADRFFRLQAEVRPARPDRHRPDRRRHPGFEPVFQNDGSLIRPILTVLTRIMCQMDVKKDKNL